MAFWIIYSVIIQSAQRSASKRIHPAICRRRTARVRFVPWRSSSRLGRSREKGWPIERVPFAVGAKAAFPPKYQSPNQGSNSRGRRGAQLHERPPAAGSILKKLSEQHCCDSNIVGRIAVWNSA